MAFMKKQLKKTSNSKAEPTDDSTRTEMMDQSTNPVTDVVTEDVTEKENGVSDCKISSNPKQSNTSVRTKKSSSSAKLSLKRKDATNLPPFRRIFESDDSSSLDTTNDFQSVKKPVRARKLRTRKVETETTKRKNIPGSSKRKNESDTSCRKNVHDTSSRKNEPDTPTRGRQKIESDTSSGKNEPGTSKFVTNIPANCERDIVDNGPVMDSKLCSDEIIVNKKIVVVEECPTSVEDKVCPTCNDVVKEGDIQSHVVNCLRQKFSKNNDNHIESDAKLAERLQKLENKKQTEKNVEEAFVFCHICEKNISHMNSVRRTQHINKCMDVIEEVKLKELKAQQALESDVDSILDCPMCGKHLKTKLSWGKHLKKCSADLNVSSEQLLVLVRKQAEEAALKSQLLPKANIRETKKKTGRRGKPKTDEQIPGVLQHSVKDKLEIIARRVSSEILKKDHNDPIPSTPSLLPSKLSNDNCDCDSTSQVSDSPPSLWSDSSRKPKGETPVKKYYVSSLPLTPVGAKVGRFKRMSWIPGRRKSIELIRENEACDVDIPMTQTAHILSDLVEQNATQTSEPNSNEGAPSETCRSNVDLDSFIAQFRAMVNNETLSDVCLVTSSEQQIHAHKFVLFARCPKMLNVLQTNEELKDTVDLQRYSYEDVLHFVTYLYTGSVEMMSENVFAVLHMAEKFGIPNLVSICEDFIQASGLEYPLLQNTDCDPIDSELDEEEGLPENRHGNLIQERDSDDAMTEKEDVIDENDVEEMYEYMCTQKERMITVSAAADENENVGNIRDSGTKTNAEMLDDDEIRNFLEASQLSQGSSSLRNMSDTDILNKVNCTMLNPLSQTLLHQLYERFGSPEPKDGDNVEREHGSVFHTFDQHESTSNNDNDDDAQEDEEYISLDTELDDICTSLAESQRTLSKSDGNHSIENRSENVENEPDAKSSSEQLAHGKTDVTKTNSFFTPVTKLWKRPVSSFHYANITKTPDLFGSPQIENCSTPVDVSIRNNDSHVTSFIKETELGYSAIESDINCEKSLADSLTVSPSQFKSKNVKGISEGNCDISEQNVPEKTKFEEDGDISDTDVEHEELGSQPLTCVAESFHSPSPSPTFGSNTSRSVHNSDSAGECSIARSRKRKSNHLHSNASQSKRPCNTTSCTNDDEKLDTTTNYSMNLEIDLTKDSPPGSPPLQSSSASPALQIPPGSPALQNLPGSPTLQSSSASLGLQIPPGSSALQSPSGCPSVEIHISSSPLDNSTMQEVEVEPEEPQEVDENDLICDPWEDFDDVGFNADLDQCDEPQLDPIEIIDDNSGEIDRNAGEGQSNEPIEVPDMIEDDVGSSTVAEQLDEPLMNISNDDGGFHEDLGNCAALFDSFHSDPEVGGEADEAVVIDEEMKTPHVQHLKKSKPATIPSPFTPMPNFDNMVTPVLKRACQQVGVRALPKKKMVLLLKDIYHKTHQYETDSEAEVSFTGSDAAKVTMAPQVVSNERALTRNATSTDGDVSVSSDDDYPSSQGSSAEDEIEIVEQSMMMRESEEETNIGSTQQKQDLPDRVYAFLKEREDIYLKILMYEPLSFCALHEQLAEAGIRCGKLKLADMLDAKCVNYTMKDTKEAQKRQEKNKKRMAKKTGKSSATGKRKEPTK